MAHRFVVDDGTTQIVAPDRTAKLTSSKYIGVFRYDPGRGVTPVPHNFVLDYSSMGSKSGNTTLFFTQIPNTEEYRKVIPISWNYTGDKPEKLRLYITTDLTNPGAQRWIQDFDPYQADYQLDFVAKSLSLNQNYYLVLYLVDSSNKDITAISANTTIPFMFVDYGLKWINAPKGELKEDDDVNVQWESINGILPVRVKVFASTTIDGTTPEIPLFVHLSGTGPIDNEIWDATRSLSLTKGVDYNVGLRALDGWGAAILDVPVVYATGMFKIKDSVSSKIEFVQPTTGVAKNPGDSILLEWKYIGDRPGKVKVFIVENALTRNGEVLIAGPADVTSASNSFSWDIPNNQVLGSYQFIAVGCDSSGNELSPLLKGDSVPFVVQDLIAPYNLNLGLAETKIPEGEPVRATWGYNPGSGSGGVVRPEGVEWFYTKDADRELYDGPISGFVSLGTSPSWITSPRNPIVNIPVGTKYFFGVRGLDARGIPIRNTVQFTEFEITAPRSYQMQFIRPNSPDVIDLFDDKSIRPRWGPVVGANTPDAVILRTINTVTGTLVEAALDPYRDSVDISASELLRSFPTLEQELLFEIIPLVGERPVAGEVQSTKFKIVKKSVVYTLKFEDQPKAEYREGEPVKVKVNCSPMPGPGEELILVLVNEGRLKSSPVRLETDNSFTWNANLAELVPDTKALFMLNLVDSVSRMPLATQVNSNLFEIKPYVDYDLNFTSTMQGTYSEGGTINLEWAWNEEPTNLDVGLYLFEKDDPNNFIGIPLTHRHQTSRKYTWSVEIPNLPNGFREDMDLILDVQSPNEFTRKDGTRYTPRGLSTPFRITSPSTPLRDLVVVRTLVNGKEINIRNVVQINSGEDLNFDLYVQDESGTKFDLINVNPRLSNGNLFTDDSSIGNRQTSSGGIAEFNWHIKPDVNVGDECVISFDLVDSQSPARANQGSHQFTVRTKKGGGVPKERAIPQLVVDGRELKGGTRFDVDLRDRDEASLYVKNIGESGFVRFFTVPSHKGLSVLPQTGRVEANPIGQEIVVRVLDRNVDKDYSVTVSLKPTGSFNLKQMLNATRMTINFRVK